MLYFKCIYFLIKEIENTGSPCEGHKLNLKECRDLRKTMAAEEGDGLEEEELPFSSSTKSHLIVKSLNNLQLMPGFLCVGVTEKVSLSLPP
jgi:hypothetical protein